MIKCYAKEEYRFFVVLTIDDGVLAIFGFVTVDCVGCNAGGGGMERDLVQQRGNGEPKAHRPPPPMQRESRDTLAA